MLVDACRNLRKRRGDALRSEKKYFGDVPRVVGIGGGSPADHQTGWAVEIRNKQPGEPSEKVQETD
jgi:hypothetical protein